MSLWSRFVYKTVQIRAPQISGIRVRNAWMVVATEHRLRWETFSPLAARPRPCWPAPGLDTLSIVQLCLGYHLATTRYFGPKLSSQFCGFCTHIKHPSCTVFKWFKLFLTTCLRDSWQYRVSFRQLRNIFADIGESCKSFIMRTYYCMHFF